MENKIRKVIRSKKLDFDFLDIFDYGVETFGEEFALLFMEEVKHTIIGLSYKFHHYPECRHLETKTQIYRNIILGKYLIIYRIRANKIEVLRAIHGSQSPEKIKVIKKIKLNKCFSKS